MTSHENNNLLEAIVLARELMVLADRGDASREDVGCGVVYGTLRDCGYKILALTEAEIAEHKKCGRWTEPGPA